MRRPKICANGTARHTTVGTTIYARQPCTALALPGHIHCESCRRAAGGYYAKSPRILDRPEGLLS